MAEQQKATIKIPNDDFTASQRREIADAVVEFIKDRTQSGEGVRKRGQGFSARDFPDYEKDYRKRKGQSLVDLVFSGEMLDQLKVVKSNTRGEIEIGYRSNGKINGKVEGNRIGSYGGSPNPRKARDFIGITRDDLEELLISEGFR